MNLQDQVVRWSTPELAGEHRTIMVVMDSRPHRISGFGTRPLAEPHLHA